MIANILIAAGSLILSGIVGAYLAWRPMNNALLTARAERRAAQKRCASLQAQRDRLAHDGVKLRGLCADFYASWAEADGDADAWWEQYTKASDIAHDYAKQLSAATAHEAEIVHVPEVVEDTPFLREIEAAVPVSPAPAWDFTGQWKRVPSKQALAAEPARIGKHRADEMAGAAA